MYQYQYRTTQNQNYSQAQLMKDQQRQSLKYSYETLGNLLSAAENFAGQKNAKYKSYNYSTANNYKDLKSEFAWELKCFKLAMDSYEKKYKKPYEFPPDCPKEAIEKDINLYLQKTNNEEDKNLFILMKEIINGKNVNIDFTNLFEKLEQNAHSNFDPRKMVQIVGPLNQILDQAENDADRGNMDLFNRDRATEKSKEQLKNISNNTIPKKKVMVGEKGKIYLSNDNNLYFESDLNSQKKKKLIGMTKINSYLIYKKNEYIIYVMQEYPQFMHCLLFNLKDIIYEKDIEIKKKFNIYNKDYIYGTIKLNGKSVDVLSEVDEDESML